MDGRRSNLVVQIYLNFSLVALLKSSRHQNMTYGRLSTNNNKPLNLKFLLLPKFSPPQKSRRNTRPFLTIRVRCLASAYTRRKYSKDWDFTLFPGTPVGAGK